MRRSDQAVVHREHHLGYRLEVSDDGAEGWIVRIYTPRSHSRPETFRNRVPNGMRTLLDEARQRIERRLTSNPEAI